VTDLDQQLRLFSERPVDEPPPLAVVWVFRRNQDELRVAQVEHERRLIVARPRAAVVERRFQTVDSLIELQTELNHTLRREGWTLARVEPDRRRGHDRRQVPRLASNQRRAL
jgi:hypothetical protein